MILLNNAPTFTRDRTYTIVDDIVNAPLAIVDLIMAPLSLADVAIVARDADLKRGMSVEDRAKLERSCR